MPTNSSLVTRHPPLPRDARDGFALLITITLLAFLVVLLVGLAAYTRIETAVASNTQRQTQARENALLGLNVALGQLQKYAGADQRVTATAESFGGVTGTKHFTGVWDTTQPAGTTPVTWLVSGNELQPGGQPAPLAIAPDASFTTANSAELVGKNSSGTALDVRARLLPVTTVGLPGATTATAATIGRYAWWVGDQGVKAPVALADPTTTAANFAYDPYTSAELRSRIRQQISLGAGAADATGAAVFEPRSTTGTTASPSNATLAANVSVTNQLAFFKTATATVGLATLQQNFQNWAANNFNVLANTKLGGLRQDLSLFSPSNPSPLGAAYDTWANYDPANGGYMEDPKSPNPNALTIVPPYSSDPMRRRYNITTPTSAGGATASVAPVLCACLINFNFQTTAATSGQHTLQGRMRLIVGLWNPYSSALVPPQTPSEDLRVVVNGLPSQVDFVDSTGNALASLPVRQMFGPQFTLQLPWTANNPSLPNLASQADFNSWLPGRVYYWTSSADTSEPNTSVFYRKNFVGLTGAGYIVRQDPSGNLLAAATAGSWIVPRNTTLTIQLFRGSDTIPLATYTSPVFPSFSINDLAPASDGNAGFGYFFRLDQNKPDPTAETWLVSAGRDPRSVFLSSGSFVAGVAGDPTQYSRTPAITNDDLLLERTMGSTGESYNEDVPVFELPRMPILSVGELQHLQLSGARPFSIGNSWGASSGLNSVPTGELFDRFYFSGLVPNMAPTSLNGALLLPNPQTKVLPRNSATGIALTADDLRNAPNAQSAKFLLQGAAFNLNSVSPAAWAAELRSVRFAAPQTFTYLNASTGSGTSGDSKTSSSLPDAQFLRFPQSAQETYEADDPVNGVTYAASTTATPVAPDSPSTANTQLFRRGMKTLTAAQIATLATKITDAIKTRQATNGPFRSIAEFLNPVSDGTPSLLEQAIIDADAAGAQINIDATGNPIEFSSQFLTQADIMTALAPVLFPRSDTFVIRAYGEALNPTTSTASAPVIEGRAWCEAIVQRVPDYFDPTAATGDAAEIAPAALVNPINTTLGRRFKIVSFRWLTRSDI